MRISRAIEKLQEIQAIYGELDVVVIDGDLWQTVTVVRLRDDPAVGPNSLHRVAAIEVD